MMDNEKIDRINTLAHKAKSVGLTEEEKKEQAELRKRISCGCTSESESTAQQHRCQRKRWFSYKSG